MIYSLNTSRAYGGRMITIIAGGRNYYLTESDIGKLDALPITEVVEGGAPGVDRCAFRYAYKKGLRCTTFNAMWQEEGRAAGPIRNRKMANYAEAVVLFPGGRGTQSMYNEAVKAGLKIYDYRKTTEEK